MIFIDRQCPSCHGNGCAECHGTGMIGSVSDIYVPAPMLEQDGFGEHMRSWRLAHGCTFRELSAETGTFPGTLCDISKSALEEMWWAGPIQEPISP